MTGRPKIKDPHSPAEPSCSRFSPSTRRPPSKQPVRIPIARGDVTTPARSSRRRRPDNPPIAASGRHRDDPVPLLAYSVRIGCAKILAEAAGA